MTESRIEGAVFYPLTPDCDIIRVGPYQNTRCAGEDRITRSMIKVLKVLKDLNLAEVLLVHKVIKVLSDQKVR